MYVYAQEYIVAVCRIHLYHCLQIWNRGEKILKHDLLAFAAEEGVLGSKRLASLINDRMEIDNMCT